MKKRYGVLLLCVLFTLSGCSQEKESADFAYQYIGSYNVYALQENSDGYYCWIDNSLFFIDKKNMQPLLLCNKPNCLHMEEPDFQKRRECNAFFIRGSVPGQLFFDATYVYLFSRTEGENGLTDVLYRIDADGTNRKVIYIFEEGKQVADAVLHRGKFCIYLWYMDERGIQHGEILTIGIDGDSTHTIAPYTLEDGKSICNMTAYDRYVYYTVSLVEPATWVLRERYVERLDIETGERIKIPPYEEGLYCINTTFADGKMYITQHKADEYEGSPILYVYSCNLDGSDMRLHSEGRVVVASDGHYLYETHITFPQIEYDSPPGDSELLIYDTSGNVLDRLALDGLPDLPAKETSLLTLFPTAGEYVIMGIRPRRGADEYLYYFPKSEIGTGNITPVQFMSYLRD